MIPPFKALLNHQSLLSRSKILFIAITGAAACYAISPESKRGLLGTVFLGHGVTKYQGFALEGVLTFLLVMTVLAATDQDREDKTFGPALSIGLSVTVCHLIGVSAIIKSSNQPYMV